MSKKTDLIDNVLRQVTLIVQAEDSLVDSIDVFGDRDYSTGLTDADCAAYGFTKEQFTDVASFVNNFVKFLDGDTVAEADYRKILNVLRTDK
jgi:hypothetical protein